MFGFSRKSQKSPPSIRAQYAPNVIAVVTFEYAGIPMYARREVKTGLVTAVAKTKGGEIELIVSVEGINLPKRVLDQEVIATLYINEGAASAAFAALA